MLVTGWRGIVWPDSDVTGVPAAMESDSGWSGPPVRVINPP